MERLYILDKTKPFDGSVLNTMPFVDADKLETAPVDYVGTLFGEYNQKHGGNLLALSWEDLNTQYLQPFLLGMQESFAPTTAESFDKALNELPPMRWTKEIGREFFFVSEPMYAYIHCCYVRKADKFYTALRNISTPAEELFQLQNVNQ